MGRRQNQGVSLTTRGRHHHHNLADASDLSWNGVHQHTGGVSRFAPGHIDPHPVQRGHLLTQQAAVLVPVTPALSTGLSLGLVVAPEPIGCSHQGLFLLLTQGMKGGFKVALT